jgi:hypothetical protein
MSLPIDPDDALPDRPLAFGEVSKLADVEGVEEVEPVVFREGHPPIVCFVLVAGGMAYTFSWHRNGGVRWEVIQTEGVG